MKDAAIVMPRATVMTRQEECKESWRKQRGALAKALVSLNLLPMFPLTLAWSGSSLVHFVGSHSLGLPVSIGEKKKSHCVTHLQPPATDQSKGDGNTFRK